MRTEATPGQWFCVWVAYGAAAPPSAGGGRHLVSGGIEPFFVGRFSIKAMGAEFSLVSNAFIVEVTVFVAFSVERDGNKTVGDRMFLGLSFSSNPGVPVVTGGVGKDEPGCQNIERNIRLYS